MRPPIADPNETSSNHFEGDDVREFRVRFWPYFVGAWIGGITGILIGSIMLVVLRRFAFLNWPLTGQIVLEAVGSVTFLTALICVYIWRFLPLQVGRWGIRGTNFWSTRCQASWEQMSSVKFVWLFYPYVVISCANSPNLWVWLWLDKPHEFARAVAEFTPSDHPLHAFLRERGW